MSEVPTDQRLTASLATLARFALDFRLICVLLGALHVSARSGGAAYIDTSTAVALMVSLLLLVRWRAVAPTVMRTPLFGGLDLVIATGLLYGAGVDGPFAYYSLGTALLGGLLYGNSGAVVLGAAGVGAWWLVVSRTVAGEPGPIDFHIAAAMPALIALCAAGGAALRLVMEDKADAEARLAAAQRAAAVNEERARLAREMHDTLGKTLHGIALSAGTLPAYVARRPEEAGQVAVDVSHAAETAAKQARELIADLRSDRVDLPLHVAVAQHASEWGAQHGIDVSVDAVAVDGLSAGSRYEMFAVLREALHNVDQHAAATRVRVRLRLLQDFDPDPFEDSGLVCLQIVDDGRGIACTDTEALAAAGHYGLLGMRERARRAGGDLRITPLQPRGTLLTVTVAAVSAADMVPLTDAPHPSEMSTAGERTNPASASRTAAGAAGGRSVAT